MELNLDGGQTKQLVEALLHAFPNRSDLEQMVKFGLNESLNAIAATGNLRHDAFQLIQWTEARGRTDELLVAARQENPGNTKLRQFAEQFDLAPDSSHLESLVLASVAFENPEQWRKRMSQCELSVCRVETPGALGTGFLVGPDLVMTNYHVMANVIEDNRRRDQVLLRFDYKVAADGTTLRTGVTYKLATGADWLLDSSPPAELDYALLKVNGSPGQDSVGDQLTAPERGWLRPEAHRFEIGEPLFIIQHPEGAPLKIAVGSVTEVKSALKRVAYTANTEPGSSGSPCFTSNWSLVALHHYGDPHANQGVLFSDILAQPKVRQALDTVPAAPDLS